MADAWGGSWGASWGSSWGYVPTSPPVENETEGGGSGSIYDVFMELDDHLRRIKEAVEHKNPTEPEVFDAKEFLDEDNEILDLSVLARELDGLYAVIVDAALVEQERKRQAIEAKRRETLAQINRLQGELRQSRLRQHKLIEEIEEDEAIDILLLTL